MDSLGNVLVAMVAVIVAVCVPWAAWARFRRYRASRRFAQLLDAQPSPVPADVQQGLERVRAAMAELRLDVERGERP
jgi:type VI protein secretion system component VasK